MPISNPAAGMTYVEVVPEQVYANTAAWVNWDLSSVIPVGALFAEIHATAGGTCDRGVRTDGSALERKFSMGTDCGCVWTVKLPASRIVEHYGDVTYTPQYTLLGYWI